MSVTSQLIYLLIYPFIHQYVFIVHNLTDISYGPEDAMAKTIMILDCHLTVVILAGNKSCDREMQLCP